MKSGRLQTAMQLHKWLDKITPQQVITIEYPPPDVWQRLYSEFNACYAIRRNKSREIVFATDEEYDADFFFNQLITIGQSDIHLVHVNSRGRVIKRFEVEDFTHAS